mgnify:CR=1 FL=1
MPLNSRNIIWITGLSGAGKSSLAKIISGKLNEMNLPTILLNGDEVRKLLPESNQTNNDEYKLENRIKIALYYSKLCSYLSNQGFNVVMATISLYKEIQDWNKLNLKNYNELYLDVPLSVLRKRDPKGIYQLYYSGKIKNVAGIDLPINEPKNPRWHFKFKKDLDFNFIADSVISDLCKS